MYVAGMLAKSAYRIRGTVPAFGARGGSTVRRSSSSSSTISRLQSTAGNRAVVQLLADGARDTPIDALPELGNRATVHLLTAQREEPKAAPAPDPKAEKKTWQDATPVGGGALYDLVNGDLKIAKILDLALPELVGLAGKGAGAGFDAATEAGGTKGEVKPIGLDTKEVTQITEAGAGWAEKAAAKWLATDDGKKLLAKAQAIVNDHPKAVYWSVVGAAAAAIGTAITLYFTNNIDPPELKKQFEIRGLKIDAGVDIGKFRERVLQSAKLGLSGKAGPGTLGVEGTGKGTKDDKANKEGYDLGATGSYTLGDPKKGGSAKLSAGYGYDTLKDQSSANLGASFKFQPLTLDTTWKFLGDGSGVLDTSLVAKLGDQYSVGAGAAGTVYGPGEAKSPLGFKLSLTSTEGKDSDKVTADLNPTTRSVTFGREATRSLWGGALTATEAHGTEGKSMGASYVRDALKLDLKYTVDKAGAQTLDAGASTKGQGFEAALTSKFGLDDGELQKLTVHLGFTTPDETVSFLHDLSISVAAGKVETSATETIKIRLKQIAGEIKGTVGESGGKQGASGASAELGWKLPSGLTLGAGLGASYTPGKKDVPVPWMVGPQVSIGHDALPIRLVGGVSVPVGAGSEGMPPVFGLSVAPNFEFLAGKKK